MRDLLKHREVTSEAPLPNSLPDEKVADRSQEAVQPTRPIEAGHSLFQGSFFFCAVKMIGGLTGPTCIYVEIALDRDSGAAFAKLYSKRSATNATDLLTSRVLPFFARRGQRIKEIHTRRTNDYCGLPLTHPFEQFLGDHGIRHVILLEIERSDFHRCEQFYSFLLKKFFQPALRKRFQLSLAELQRDLDGFLNSYNAGEIDGPAFGSL